MPGCPWLPQPPSQSPCLHSCPLARGRTVLSHFQHLPLLPSTEMTSPRSTGHSICSQTLPHATSPSGCCPARRSPPWPPPPPDEPSPASRPSPRAPLTSAPHVPGPFSFRTRLWVLLLAEAFANQPTSCPEGWGSHLTPCSSFRAASTRHHHKLPACSLDQFCLPQ